MTAYYKEALQQGLKRKLYTFMVKMVEALQFLRSHRKGYGYYESIVKLCFERFRVYGVAKFDKKSDI